MPCKEKEGKSHNLRLWSPQQPERLRPPPVAVPALPEPRAALPAPRGAEKRERSCRDGAWGTPERPDVTELPKCHRASQMSQCFPNVALYQLSKPHLNFKGQPGTTSPGWHPLTTTDFWLPHPHPCARPQATLGNSS